MLKFIRIKDEDQTEHYVNAAFIVRIAPKAGGSWQRGATVYMTEGKFLHVPPGLVQDLLKELV